MQKSGFKNSFTNCTSNFFSYIHIFFNSFFTKNSIFNKKMFQTIKRIIFISIYKNLMILVFQKVQDYIFLKALHIKHSSKVHEEFPMSTRESPNFARHVYIISY